MPGWQLTTVLLCNYGFWKEVRPSVPFLTPFLVSPVKNFTDAQLYSQIYPFWTYSYLVMLIPIFILTDLLRYKPIIITEVLAYMGTWVLLIWGQSVLSMQLMQVVYGWATAAEVAYYAYIYAVIHGSHYQKATSYIRGAVLAGRFVAYGLGQLLVSTGLADYMLLNYISLISVSLILIIAIFLPNPPSALSIQEQSKEDEETTPLKNKNHEGPSGSYIGSYFRDLFSKFRRCYSVSFVVKWSLWWALATCGFFQIGNYIQNLWAEMQEGEQSVFNGVTEAISTLLGALSAVVVQWLRVNWSLTGEWALGVISVFDGVLLFVLSSSNSLFLAYVLYIIFCVLYQMLITIATFNVASRLEADSYGLVFGCNTFAALILQTLLTFSVADQHGFALSIRPQFLVYASYHGVIGLVFLAMGAVSLYRVGFRQCCALIKVQQNNNSELPKNEPDIPIQGDDPSLKGAEVYTTRV